MAVYKHENENGKYTLTLNYMGQWTEDGERPMVSYGLYKDGDDTAIFTGGDFCPSPMFASLEGPEAAEALLSFLLLQEGDTDSECFTHYIPRQWSFSRNEAESLYNWQAELNPLEHPEG